LNGFAPAFARQRSLARLEQTVNEAGASPYPEDRQPENQEHEEDHDKDVEQEARDVGGSGGDAGESEQAGDDRYHQEDQGPFQQCHNPLLRLVAPPRLRSAASGANFRDAASSWEGGATSSPRPLPNPHPGGSIVQLKESAYFPKFPIIGGAPE
jgi:hypothetical protein